MDIESLVAANELRPRIGRALTLLLELSIRALERELPRLAVLKLRAFVFVVRVLIRTRQLPRTAGEALIREAGKVIGLLSGC
ncbi:MAG: hypothetical protein ACE5F1_04180 [Planctomycetota bacterium]